MTVFDLDVASVQEVPPGHVVVVKKNGRLTSTAFTAPLPRAACSFERIYFSRGNDLDIYRERKALGARLADQVMAAIDHDLQNTVIGFIPNTAEVAYYGLMEALRLRRRDEVKRDILDAAKKGTLDEALIDDLILRNCAAEKVSARTSRSARSSDRRNGARTVVARLRHFLWFRAADGQSGGR